MRGMRFSSVARVSVLVVTIVIFALTIFRYIIIISPLVVASVREFLVASGLFQN